MAQSLILITQSRIRLLQRLSVESATRFLPVKGGGSSTGEIRKIWQCSERYKVKGVIGCNNRHVEESALEKAFIMAWNEILDNKEYFLRKWEEQELSEDLLVVYRAKDFMELMKLETVDMDINSILRVLDCIKVFENGQLLVKFMDGTEVECNKYNH